MQVVKQTGKPAMSAKLPFVAIFLLVTGCADLGAVREFSKASGALHDYNEITDAYVAQPVRAMKYKENINFSISIKAREETKKKFEQTYKVLAAYMEVLGALSQDDLVNFDGEIDGLTSAVKDSGFIAGGDEAANITTLDSAGKVAQIVVDIIAGVWRQHELGKIIQEANPIFQKTVSGLVEVYQQDFTQIVEDSCVADEKYLLQPFGGVSGHECITRKPEPEEHPSHSKQERIAKYLMFDKQDRSNVEIQKIKHNVEILKKIAQAHSDLAKNSARLDGDDLKKRMVGYIRDLRGLISSIQKL